MTEPSDRPEGDMTDQEILDLTLDLLRKRGGLSKKDNSCYYRHPDGQRACAVGVHIPDGHPSLRWEKEDDVTSALPLFEKFPDLLDVPVLRERPPEWWLRVQACHDTAEDVDEMPRLLSRKPGVDYNA